MISVAYCPHASRLLRHYLPSDSLLTVSYDLVVLQEHLFNVSVGNVDSRIECTLCKFADDMKQSGAVSTLGGREVIQRDMGAS